jgi:CDP-paratose 2-epimerase
VDNFYSLGNVASIRDRIGLCQWFQFEDRLLLQATVRDLAELGVQHLRTGISWADYHRPGGKRWYDHQMQILSDAGLTVLLSLWHTPPSLSESGSCSGPPRRLLDFADFLDEIVNRYTGQFDGLELWNEPNNRLKWDFTDYDPDWSKFAEMIAAAAYWAKHLGQRTVLGGMIPVDHHWLSALERRGALESIDVIAIHAFPGMWTGSSYWWDWPGHWTGWPAKLQSIIPSCKGRPVWITESGYATCKGNSPTVGGFIEQSERLLNALLAPAERLYWYCVRDLSYNYACIEMTEDGGRIDHREYHLGLSTVNGGRKTAWWTLQRALRGEPLRASYADLASLSLAARPQGS